MAATRGVLLVAALLLSSGVDFGTDAKSVLMITMGGTKSHKILFWELARALIPRGHEVTFLSGFTPDFQLEGLREVAPPRFVDFVRNFTDWDLVGARFAGRAPISLRQAMRYPAESCEHLLADAETSALLMLEFHVALVDGAFPECALGLAHRLGAPVVLVNTVGFYTGSLALAGNPVKYAVTPHVFTAYTGGSMGLVQRLQNAVTHLAASLVHQIYTHQVHRVLRLYLGPATPHPYSMARNVSFVLQNGHPALTDPRPLLPNVVEIACIHCRPAAAAGAGAANGLPAELESFVSASPVGFIYLSMGSSVKASNMPEAFRKLLVAVFARLPQYQVLWKWDGNASQMAGELSPNVRLGAWLPQQDILGHRMLRAFITHGGLLSMFEAVYHAVPMVMLPVFCDHDVNAARAAADGYAVRLPLEQVTVERLLAAVLEVIHNDAYLRAVRERRRLLLDQPSTPLETAVFWTEFVLRHKGASHLQALGRDMSFLELHSLDVLGLVAGTAFALLLACRRTVGYFRDRSTADSRHPKRE